VNPKRPLSLKVRALQWLSQREHSRSELRQRLLRLAQAPHATPLGDEPVDPQAEVETLLDWLQAHRYLSDARFLESRVQVRAQRFGNARIEGELRQHGVDVDAATRQQLRDSELDRARALWQRKYGAAASDAAQRLKQMRFLTGRGFSADVVRKVLKASEDDPA
jgi:regulatory protein